MRFYLKLFVLIVVFVCASRWPLRRAISDLAYDARVGLVCAFGGASAYETLIDDTQRTLASENGNLDLYLRGIRYRQLLAERLAAAARLNISLNDDDIARIREECQSEAWGTSPAPARSSPTTSRSSY